MHVLNVRNVQEAYVRGLALVRSEGIREETRNGPALVVPMPVTTVYERPLERVLLDPVRDANPFFHLMEAFWMLAGRNDVASLEPFLGGLKQYSDNGLTYHGAYGYRWRNHFYDTGQRVDQLARLIELLRAQPTTRQAVLGMWDPAADLAKAGRDFPCNTQVYFRTRPYMDGLATRYELDMTITCRSNDAIWGAYGANVVHFSVLQEFVAAACGFRVGRMYQVSNNLHAYLPALSKVGYPDWPVQIGDETITTYLEPRPEGDEMCTLHTQYGEHTEGHRVLATPLFTPCPTAPVEAILAEIDALWADEMDQGWPEEHIMSEEQRVLVHDVRNAHRCFKSKNRDAARQHVADMPEGSDWQRACGEWLERRYHAS